MISHQKVEKAAMTQFLKGVDTRARKLTHIDLISPFLSRCGTPSSTADRKKVKQMQKRE